MGKSEKFWQVTVNMLATYEVAGATEAEAKRAALAAARNGEAPDALEYNGDGIDDCVLVSGDDE